MHTEMKQNTGNAWPYLIFLTEIVVIRVIFCTENNFYIISHCFSEFPFRSVSDTDFLFKKTHRVFTFSLARAFLPMFIVNSSWKMFIKIFEKAWTVYTTKVLLCSFQGLLQYESKTTINYTGTRYNKYTWPDWVIKFKKFIWEIFKK